MNVIRGKLTGGSSAVNVTFACRGWPDDYDRWAHLANECWSFADVLPYFRKLERDLDFATARHGRDGPVPIRRHQPLSESHAAFIEACAALGHRRVSGSRHRRGPNHRASSRGPPKHRHTDSAWARSRSGSWPARSSR
jgi:choline dehydrogenase-like flavoprotein